VTTSIETRIMRYESCDCAIYRLNESIKKINDEMRSVGPSHPDMIGLPARVGL